MFLRVYIDKEGGVGIDECEAVSRALDPILDEEDPIPDSYVFEVGSPGIERELKRPSDFLSFIGSDVELRLYTPVNGQKVFFGVLKSYEDDIITITVGNEDKSFKKSDTALCRLHVTI